MFGHAHPAPQCGEESTLSMTEREHMRISPWDTVEPPMQVHCALQSQHPGSHMAYLRPRHFVDQSAWWLVWNDVRRGWHPLPACTAVYDLEYEICQLPAEHPGHHSWLLARSHADAAT